MTDEQIQFVALELSRLAKIEQAYHLSDTTIPELDGLLAGVDPVELRDHVNLLEQEAQRRNRVMIGRLTTWVEGVGPTGTVVHYRATPMVGHLSVTPAADPGVWTVTLVENVSDGPGWSVRAPRLAPQQDWQQTA